MSKLRELAAAATPGPWKHDLDMFDSDVGLVALVHDDKDLLIEIGTDLTIAEPADGSWTDEDSKRRDAQWTKARWGQEYRDAAYIAAANPQAVIALIDTLSAVLHTLRTTAASPADAAVYAEARALLAEHGMGGPGEEHVVATREWEGRR